MNGQCDFEGAFHLVDSSQGGKHHPVSSGYRPLHRLYDNVLSSGEHAYPDKARLAPGETAAVRVRLLTPEAYPGCLWPGRELDVMEGPARVIGKLTVTHILNAVLSGDAAAYSPHWTAPEAPKATSD